jgi:hypothetical protein
MHNIFIHGLTQKNLVNEKERAHFHGEHISEKIHRSHSFHINASHSFFGGHREFAGSKRSQNRLAATEGYSLSSCTTRRDDTRSTNGQRHLAKFGEAWRRSGDGGVGQNCHLKKWFPLLPNRHEL